MEGRPREDEQEQRGGRTREQRPRGEEQGGEAERGDRGGVLQGWEGEAMSKDNFSGRDEYRETEGTSRHRMLSYNREREGGGV